jgi:hypothetical protein
MAMEMKRFNNLNTFETVYEVPSPQRDGPRLEMKTANLLGRAKRRWAAPLGVRRAIPTRLSRSTLLASGGRGGYIDR